MARVHELTRRGLWGRGAWGVLAPQAAAAAMGLTASARMAPPMPPPDVVLVLRKMLSAEMLRDPQEIADVRFSRSSPRSLFPSPTSASSAHAVLYWYHW